MKLKSSDNKSTQARVGTIMTVPEKKGMEWIKKGYAKDLSDLGPADPISWIWWKRLKHPGR